MSHYSVEALKLLDDLNVDELMNLRKANYQYKATESLSSEAQKVQKEKELLQELRKSFWSTDKENEALKADLQSLSDHPSLKDKDRLLKLLPFRQRIDSLNVYPNAEIFTEYFKVLLVSNNQIRNQMKKAFYDEFRKDDLVIARKVVRRMFREERMLFLIEELWLEQVLNPRKLQKVKIKKKEAFVEAFPRYVIMCFIFVSLIFLVFFLIGTIGSI